MRIRDRNTWPNGGWIFYQPETNWWAPDPMSNSFTVQVSNIIAHRSINPRFNLSTDRTSVENDLENYTCARLNNNPQWCLGDVSPTNEVSSQKKTSPLPNQKHDGLVARLAANARKLRDGGRIIKAWLGDSMAPVNPALADQRAITCLNCPLHDNGKWFDKITGELAEAILSLARFNNAMGLEAANESGLGTCKACLCHMATKIWIPIEHIRRNTSQSTLKELDAKCWIKNEP